MEQTEEMRVPSLGWEDPLGVGMATHSRILAWRIPWTEESGRGTLEAQIVKNPPAMWKTWVRSLGHEDPLEEGVATHSSILAWRIPWREEPGGLQSMGLQRVGHD